jgi:hypothetical protein
MDRIQSIAENYDWTTGGDYSVSHRKWIASGYFGEVHEVSRLLTVTETHV